MAINLWEAEGKPTAYNPLPLSTVNRVYVGIGDYTITFKANSPTKSLLKVGDIGEQDLNQTLTLTNDFKSYTFTFKSSMYQQIYLYDLNSVSDIIIEDIKLVEKPLGVATINGVDGFLSGKWVSVYPATTTFIDDETVQLEVLTNGTTYTIDNYINVLPNTTYTLKADKGIGTGGYVIRKDDGSVNYVNSQDIDSLGKTFTTDSTTTRIYLRLFNRVSIEGEKHVIKRPMLNLGSTPAPYEKKRGERMVLPVAKKNLYMGFKVHPFSTSASVDVISDTKMIYTPDVVNRNGSVLLNVKPNTNYHVSFSAISATIGNGRVAIWNEEVTSPLVGYMPNNFTFNSGNRHRIRLYIRNESVIEPITFENIQLEEGTTATPFEPYAVQVNEKVKMLVPKKNLIKPFTEWALHPNAKVISPYELELNSPTLNSESFIDCPVVEGQTYYLNHAVLGSEGRIFIRTLDIQKNVLSSFHTNNYAPTSFPVPVGTKFFRVIFRNVAVNVDIRYTQPTLTLGSVVEPFEPYKEGNRKSVRVEDIFDRAMESGYFNPFGVGAPMVSATHKRNINFMPIKPLTNYVLISNKINNFYIHFYDSLKNFISSFQSIGKDKVVYDSTNTPTNARYVKFHFDDTGSSGVNYELHQFYEENKFISKPSTGLLMDGVTNYLLFPSMTMDSVEIDCLIDPSMDVALNRYLFDGRTGLTNGYVYTAGFGPGVLNVFVDGQPITREWPSIPKGKRISIKTDFTEFTDNFNIFSANSGTAGTYIQGVLYRVKCYLKGQVVAEYDFTKENAKANSVLLGTKNWQQKQAKR